MVTRIIIFSIVSLFTSNTTGFTIGLPESTHQAPYKTQLESAFNSIYEGIEKDISFEYLPFNRSVHLIQTSQLDAIAYQLDLQSTITHGTVRINEPLTQFRLYAACLKESPCSLSQDSHFVVVKDALYTNQICQNIGLHCLFLSSTELAYKALGEGIADAYLMQQSVHITAPCPTGIQVKTYAIANTQIDIYHFIKASRADITEKLAERLKILKEQYRPSFKSQCHNLEAGSILIF